MTDPTITPASKPGPKPKPILDRFWSKVDKRGPDDCWLWTSSTVNGGYGIFSHGKERTRAHRFAWTIAHGPVPDGMFVCHSCDVPGCVNERHLWIGSNAENLADMAAKGRKVTTPMNGESNGGAKLTFDKVLAIRGSFLGSTVLSRIYGVCPEQIRRIKDGRKWANV